MCRAGAVYVGLVALTCALLLPPTAWAQQVGLYPQHPDHRGAALAVECPPVVGGLARALGGRDPGCRRDEFWCFRHQLLVNRA